MPKLIVESSRLIATVTDFHNICDGITLVFPDGGAVYLQYRPKTSEENGLLFDPDPAKGNWVVSNGDARIDMEDHTLLVGPKNTKEGYHLQVTAEPTNVHHVSYQFWERFRVDLPFAALPTSFFQFVQIWSSKQKDEDKPIPSGGRALYVACHLMQTWIASKADFFSGERDRLNRLVDQVRGPLNEIGKGFDQLLSPRGQVGAMELILGPPFHDRDAGLIQPS